ncbi:TetR/AcrR family transcriptional regulator [Actinomadura darangshiensis]|uniref:TetR/AcrR family transcriptional regulator n=1 Tax=Actinomadura darangshiensis TaxID=705336 RepID=A0A4R4ZMV7_9ACTN|nr:TetR/AcrR family transcriptional regulator [Actinomadura darangshiensis]TDD58202.1 TetR/AcrR family transcriptional regulator [Actinomadura darangshiensis]
MATRRAETSRESRRLLVEAASGLFAEKGYRQTTVADVADRSGISRGSIPWHFGDKEGLLLAVIEHTFLEMTQSFSERHPAGPDGLAELMEQAEAFARVPTTRLLVSLLADAVEPGSPIHHRYAELHATMRRIFTAWAAQPHVAVRLPDGATPEDFGLVTLSAAVGIYQQWRMAPEGVDLAHAFGALRLFLTAAVSPAGSR